MASTSPRKKKSKYSQIEAGIESGAIQAGGTPQRPAPPPRVQPASSGASARTAPSIRRCLCGCGSYTARLWVQGHDGRAAGWVRKLSANKPVPGMERDEAISRLKKIYEVTAGTPKGSAHIRHLIEGLIEQGVVKNVD